MDKRKEIIIPLDTKEDKDHSISAKLGNQEQRQKLLGQIAMLKTYISVLEHKLETLKFGQLKLPEKTPWSLHSDKTATYYNILNVQIKLLCDLYRFTGIRCTKCKDSFVFEMSSTCNVTRSNLYAVQILIDNHVCGKLGKWILPMSVDIEKILSQHPIDDLNNVKHFLKCCKHHVDCYISRVEQLEKLQNLFARFENARLFHRVGVMQLELTMSGMKDIESDAVRNVILYLCYNAAEARPYKLLPDTDDKEKPSANLFKRLNKHFKPFLKNDLCSAFQCVSESQTEFLWKPIIMDENERQILEISDDSFENTEFLSMHLSEDNKTRKRKKNKEQGEVSASHVNEPETFFEEAEDIDVEKVKKRDDFSGNDKKINSRKPKQMIKKTKIIKSKSTLDGSRDFEKEVLNTEKNVPHNVDKSNKPEPKVENTKNRVKRRKLSKKPQMNIENPGIQDNNVLLKSNNNQENLSANINNRQKRNQNRELLKKSNDLDRKDAKSFQSTQKRIKIITQVDKGKTEDKEENKENSTIPNGSKRNRQGRINVSSSTPVTKKLPDKHKFFHTNRISEIL